MADQNENATWPMPKFTFSLTWGDATFHFSEVSGLDADAQEINYRQGGNPTYTTIKMPGIQRLSNLTLKRGLWVGEHKFLDWLSKINNHPIERATATIQLLDERGQASMTWNLHNAWLTKITTTEESSAGNEAAIETLELGYETLTVAH